VSNPATEHKANATKLRNGTIAFLGSSQLPGPVFLELTITNSFPMLVLRNAYWLKADGAIEDVSAYDHLSIPPDLRLHLSGPDHLFFDAASLWRVADGSGQQPFAHCFTAISPPHYRSRPFVEPGARKRLNQCAFISPLHDKAFNGTTRLGIDFFVHRWPLDTAVILQQPYIVAGTRLARDATGSVAGPYSFDSLQRRAKPRGPLAFSIRMTYVDMEDDASLCFYTPLPVFARRQKLP
jgi:hypothetical protein